MNTVNEWLRGNYIHVLANIEVKTVPWLNSRQGGKLT